MHLEHILDEFEGQGHIGQGRHLKKHKYEVARKQTEDPDPLTRNDPRLRCETV